MTIRFIVTPGDLVLPMTIVPCWKPSAHLRSSAVGAVLTRRRRSLCSPRKRLAVVHALSNAQEYYIQIDIGQTSRP